MTRNILVLLALVGMAATGAAQTQGQSRDARTTPVTRTGTAELAVYVSTDEQNSRPLRRVSVSLQAGELDVPNIGVTDEQGRVVFRNLSAGNYLLTAMRSGYVRTFYGSRFPGRGPGVAVSVLDGQKVSNVNIRMLRGSILTGTVRTASGRPAANQPVQSILVKSGSGERRAVAVEPNLGSTVTDDRGTYRIFGLAPGDYIVLVPSTAGATDELRQMTSGELKWADSVVSGGVTAAPATGVPAAPNGAPPVANAPVYFPGTANVSDAAVITLGPNEERAGIDFTMQLVPTAQISGRVIDAEGRPQANVSISLKPNRTDGLDLFSALFNSTGRTTADGTFTIRGVKPGAYTMSVRATPKAEAPAGAPVDPMAQARQEMAAVMGSANGSHYAQEEIAVQGRDIQDVVLTLRPGMTISGRIVYESTTKTPPTDLSRTSLMLMGNPTGTGMNDLIGALTGGGSVPLKVDSEGKFTVTGVTPGKYRLNMPFAMLPIPGMPQGGGGGGWTLKGAMVSGRDAADSPLEVRPGVDVSNVVITFTDQPSELSGTVIDAAGRVTPDFPIIVFSTDKSYWTLGSRRVQTARPSSDGKFKVSGLPAGEYFVCAVTAVDRTEAYDPAFLSQLSGSSFIIAIKDGEKKVQDLKLGGGK
jgi:hypothetical protein